ncbi:hypothetical protein L7F22_048180, partial [Adiantum nelumboides]|nr:hypothetical protein [Adiantum nelumboides]
DNEVACPHDSDAVDALPDFQPGDPYIPLVNTAPCTTIAG